jgi:hypothetical protein
LSYPSNCTNGKGITICELKKNPSNDKENKGVSKGECKEIEYEVTPYSNIKLLYIENNHIITKKPLGLVDNECIIIEIQKEMYTKLQIDSTIKELQQCKESKTLMNIWDTLDTELRSATSNVIAEKNGAVVNFSPTASATLRCNTAAYHLGGNEQAKATLHYLIKCITKDALTPITSLSLLSHAREKVTSYPSLANDTGTDLRTGKHLLTVMINKSTSCKEIADTQAALYLWGIPAQFGNVKNSYIFINDSYRKIKQRIQQNKIHAKNCINSTAKKKP